MSRIIKLCQTLLIATSREMKEKIMSLGFAAIVFTSQICWKFINSKVFRWVFIVDITLLGSFLASLSS